MCPSGSAIAIPLGPTNPSLITIAKETLVFRRAGFSPALRLLVPTFLLPNAPPWVTPLASLQIGILSYHYILPKQNLILSFGITLNPDYLRRIISQQVSCYAIFKGWLPLSQPPCCLRKNTTLSILSVNLGTLNRDAGCFPFDHGAQPPQSNCQTIYFQYSEFDRSRGISTCRDLPVLYPQKVHLTLAQKLFRREPAITKLDQLFTSYLKSSESFARLNGSDLPIDFSMVHPAQGKLALVSGLMYKTNALLILAFAMAPPGKGLSPLHTSTRWLILQQARRDGLDTMTNH